RSHQGHQASGFEYLGGEHVAVLVLTDGEPPVHGVDPFDRLLSPRAAVAVAEPDTEIAHRRGVTTAGAAHRGTATVAVEDLGDAGYRSLSQEDQYVGQGVQQRVGVQPVR